MEIYIRSHCLRSQDPHSSQTVFSYCHILISRFSSSSRRFFPLFFSCQQRCSAAAAAAAREVTNRARANTACRPPTTRRIVAASCVWTGLRCIVAGATAQLRLIIAMRFRGRLLSGTGLSVRDRGVGWGRGFFFCVASIDQLM
jgi:hypothetical protein